MEDYIISNGERIMSPEYIKEQEVNYLKAHNLHQLKSTEKERVQYAKILLKSIKWGEPALIYYKKDISNDIFATILALINRKIQKFISYDVVTVNYLCDQYIDVKHDISTEFDFCKILFVVANVTDTPHMYNAYCLRNIALERAKKGKLTFIFFKGTSDDLMSNSWCIDEDGLGTKAIGYDMEEKKVIDSRRLTPLSTFIKSIDLNERLK